MNKHRVVYSAQPYAKVIIASDLTFDEAKKVLNAQTAPMLSANRDQQPIYYIEPDD